jgi:cytidylate kinase
LIIALDGPAASGKSTTAKALAKHLGWLYLDTGAMYRALTLACLEAGVDPYTADNLEYLATRHQVRLKTHGDATIVLLDGADVSDKIRLPEVARAIKPIADDPGVRGHLVAQQREIGSNQDSVVDGRDIGTVVFPAAELKIYMVAGVEERARRRQKELSQKGVEMSLEALANDIRTRDEADMSRPVGALRKAEDAIEIDTTNLSINAQIEKILALWKMRKP